MSDFLMNLANHPATKGLVKSLGLPAPLVLSRGKGGYEADPLAGKLVYLGGAPGGYATKALQAAIKACGGETAELISTGEGAPGIDVLVFDATGCKAPADYKAVYDFFHPIMRQLARCARILVVAGHPETAENAVSAAAARGLEGFVRSLAKEIGKKGATANVAYVEKGAENRLEGVVRFFCTHRTAYVDGQAVRVTTAVKGEKKPAFTEALKGKVALVTGGARGIGAATAERLAAEGAHVVVLDIPQDMETLHNTAAAIRGTPLALDITNPEAPKKIADFFKSKFGGVDVVVHNAGVTRDKMLANMKEQLWNMVVNINFAAITAIDDALIADGVIREGGRIVCLSSIAGVAGNAGQTNYGLTKAALIGYVAARAPELAGQGICINAVAPGFIETRMTAAIPLVIREAGRRMNSMSQGGQPQDVAEIITFFSCPGSVGITGNTVRVCGQSLIGA